MAEQKNPYFGKLLKAGIGAIANLENLGSPVIEEELAREVGLSFHAIQKYKSGVIPPDNNLIRNIVIRSVQKGMMGYTWACKFLAETEYPAPYVLINELFPKPESKTIEILHNNLPAPSYSKFIMRKQEFENIVEGLQNRSAIVLIRSLGGMGKTSLAREVAHQCISKEKEYAWLPKFDSAVWISDANNPGSTNLTIVLDEIAQTLGLHEITKQTNKDKRFEINRVLRMHKILLIVDNFETIKDNDLLKWLTELPEPSKCIVTTREYHRAFRNNTRDIELGGMKQNEARELIENKMIDLRIEYAKNKIEDFDILIDTCGGNPKAIEIALGIIKYDKRTLQETLDELVSIKGDLFKSLFKRVWEELLNEDGKNILKLMAMFPFGTKETPLKEISGINDNDFHNALSQLIDLSLINAKDEGIYVESFYYLHPLVNAFAGQKLKESSDFETPARIKWFDYYYNLSENIGFCWNDIEKLKILDGEGLKEGIEYAIRWAYDNHHFDFVIDTSENIKYYFYIRGIWSSKLNLLRYDAAKHTGNILVQFNALVYQLNILCKQGNTEKAEHYLKILDDILADNEFNDDLLIDYNHALALCHLRKGEFDKAIDLWEKNLSNVTINEQQLNANKRWLGICYFEKGEIEKAKPVLEQLANDIDNNKLIHSALSANIYLTKIDLLEGKNEKAFTKINTSLETIKHTKDEAFLPEYEWLYAQYLLTENKTDEATEYFQNAIEHFTNLGQNEKAYKVKVELNKINKK